MARSLHLLRRDKHRAFHSYHVGGALFLLGDGSVRFISENIDHTNTNIAANDANVNGPYRLMFTATKYGAMPGSHRVEMNITKMSKDELAEMRAAGEEVPEQSLQIPRQYQQSGALTATVSSGRTEIDFALTSK